MVLRSTLSEGYQRGACGSSGTGRQRQSGGSPQQQRGGRFAACGEMSHRGVYAKNSTALANPFQGISPVRPWLVVASGADGPLPHQFAG